ncbi:MAG TPA: hypothetical protein VFS00_32930, partial [Polyangiaceae bacterium]|nr:hypothetical protein [Polyangiaceae bacterium]
MTPATPVARPLRRSQPDATPTSRARHDSGPGLSLDDVPDLHAMAEGPSARDAFALTPPRAPRPPHQQASSEFGQLDLPVSAPEADLPAPKYEEADLPSPKLPPPDDAGEAGPYDADAFLPSPLNRPSRRETPAAPSPSSFGLLADVLDASAKPSTQTLSGGFLAPGVLRRARTE